MQVVTIKKLWILLTKNFRFRKLFELGKFSKHAGLIISLAVLVIIFNYNESSAYNDAYVDSSLESTQQIVSAIAPYTGNIDESGEQIKIAFDGVEDFYLQKPKLNEALKSPTKHTIQKGETLLSISRKYGISVSTILEANNIKADQIDKITPDSVITIPPYNTTTSIAWLDEVNRIQAEKELQRQKDLESERKRQIAISNKRSLSNREFSTSRQISGADYSGTSESNFSSPVKTKGISRGISAYHQGIDMRCDVGTPIVASKSGVVNQVTSGWSGGYGNSVVINHGSGLITRYAHMSSTSVGAGQTVSAGSIIGYCGSTGRSTGPHLHFEARSGGRIFNPF